MSHPVWVRGLKLVFGLDVLGFFRSHPVWVRGLKLDEITNETTDNTSHPVWVRGLKLKICPLVVNPPSRTPCGCVD